MYQTQLELSSGQNSCVIDRLNVDGACSALDTSCICNTPGLLKRFVLAADVILPIINVSIFAKL
jgi:hypothetical protein